LGAAVAELRIPSHGRGQLRSGHHACPRTTERLDDEGIVERQCRTCRDWMVLDLFCKDINCHRGRTHECKACRQKRRQPLDYRRERGAKRKHES
jgi:hypothetical protein